MGIKKLPFVEQACIREISASDYSNKNYRHLKYDGVIEFITDKELDDRQNILRGSYKRNLSYNDFITNDSLAILISYDVVFVKEMNDKFFIKHCLFRINPMITYYVIVYIARFYDTNVCSYL